MASSNVKRRLWQSGASEDFDHLGGSIKQHFAQRNQQRQQLVRRLHDAGPRPVLVALIEVENGEPLDVVLKRFGRLCSETYRILGADRLPIEEEHSRWH
jgi:hypothetical protein